MARFRTTASQCIAGTRTFFVVFAVIGPSMPHSAMAEAVMPSNPAYAWVLDEGTGTAAYPTFGTGTGTLKNAASWSTNCPFAYAGNHSAYFPAKRDYLAFPGHTTVSSGSMQFWAYTTDIGGGDYYFNSPSGSGRLYFWLHTSASTTAGLGLNGVAAGNFAKPADNVWNHVVITWDESLSTDNVKVYVSNSLGKSVYPMTKVLGSGVETGTIYVGSASNNLGYAGYLDEVAFWDVPLSAENVDWLYRNSITLIPEPGTGTVAGLCVLGLLIARRRRRPSSP